MKMIRGLPNLLDPKGKKHIIGQAPNFLVLKHEEHKTEQPHDYLDFRC